MDGIEIPNINHFATQGLRAAREHRQRRSGARDQVYTGAFPADRAGALSSVLDFPPARRRPRKHSFKRRSAHRKCR